MAEALSRLLEASGGVGTLGRGRDGEAEPRTLLQSVLASMSDGVVAVDTTGQIVLFNDAAERILGLGPTDSPPDEWSQLYHLYGSNGRTPYPTEQLPILRALRGEEIDDVILYVRRGRELGNVWISVNARPLRVAGGGIGGAVATFRDISSQHLAEQQNRATSESLRRSNRDLEDFIHVVSHDLQDPLKKVQAFSRLLVEEYGEELRGEAVEYVARIEGAARHMEAFIRALLRYSRESIEGVKLKRVDLGRIALDARDLFEHTINELDASVSVDQLPTIEADATQMLQLFQNLIGNALKFCRQGIAPDVQIRGRILGDTERLASVEGHAALCEIEVEDNGVGIESEEARRVFHVFHRARSSKDFPGSGVGLSVCRRIIERHHGTIEVQPAPSAGSIFVIRLPLWQPAPRRGAARG